MVLLAQRHQPRRRPVVEPQSPLARAVDPHAPGASPRACQPSTILASRHVGSIFSSSAQRIYRRATLALLLPSWAYADGRLLSTEKPGRCRIALASRAGNQQRHGVSATSKTSSQTSSSNLAQIRGLGSRPWATQGASTHGFASSHVDDIHLSFGLESDNISAVDDPIPKYAGSISMPEYLPSADATPDQPRPDPESMFLLPHVGASRSTEHTNS